MTRVRIKLDSYATMQTEASKAPSKLELCQGNSISRFLLEICGHVEKKLHNRTEE